MRGTIFAQVEGEGMKSEEERVEDFVDQQKRLEREARSRQWTELSESTGLGGLIAIGVTWVWPVFLVNEAGRAVGWGGFLLWLGAAMVTWYFAILRGWLMETGEERKKRGKWKWGGL